MSEAEALIALDSGNRSRAQELLYTEIDSAKAKGNFGRVLALYRILLKHELIRDVVAAKGDVLAAQTALATEIKPRNPKEKHASDKSPPQGELLNRVMGTLSQSAVLKNLPVDACMELLKDAPLERYEDRQRILDPGEQLDRIYQIVSGNAFIGRSAHLGEEKIIARLNPGDIFGEISYLTRRPSSHSVIASGMTELLRFDRDRLDPILAKYPKLEAQIVAIQTDRIRFAKFAMSPIFSDISDAHLLSILRMAKVKSVNAGVRIIGEGDKRARSLFLIESGSVSVEKRSKDQVIPVAKLSEGDVFGEASFVEDDAKATATVRTIEATQLLYLDELAYRKIVREIPMVIKNIVALRELRKTDLDHRLVEVDRDAIDIVAPLNLFEVELSFKASGVISASELPPLPFFGDLPRDSILKILEGQPLYHLQSQQFLNWKGALADYVYLLLGGRALVYDHRADGSLIRLADLEAGDLFGEGALIGPSAKRSFFVQSMTPVAFVRFSRREFTQLFLRDHPAFRRKLAALYVHRKLLSYLVLSPVFQSLPESTLRSLATAIPVLGSEELDRLNASPLAFDGEYFLSLSPGAHLYQYQDGRPYFLKSLEPGVGVLLGLSDNVRVFVEDKTLAVLITHAHMEKVPTFSEAHWNRLREISEAEIHSSMDIYKSLWSTLSPVA